MAYTALPDRRMPYHRDGTRIGYCAGHPTSISYCTGNGFSAYLPQSDAIELNDGDYAALSVNLLVDAGSTIPFRSMWFFFPEQREVTGGAFGFDNSIVTYGAGYGVQQLEGSNDSTNGVDGTWEVASFPGGQPYGARPSLDGWRSSIKAISLTGGKSSIRLTFQSVGGGGSGMKLLLAHLYGEKAAGQTPDDLIFIDHDTTPGVEYTAPEDFGNRPLATSVVRQFRVKNASGTLTASTINLQCNDSDFAISTDGTTWVVTINIASLAPGAESSTMYVRNTTPAAGNLLGPRFAEIVMTAGSWT